MSELPPQGPQGAVYDLLIRGGTVVTEAGHQLANVAVRDGKIASVGLGELHAQRIIDAAGLLVLPGGIDAHTHLNSVWPFPDERRPSDDFESGTRGAAAGGITTVCDFVYPLESETLIDAFTRVRDAAVSSHVDFGLHMVVTTLADSSVDEVEEVIAAGMPSFKFYTPQPDFMANGSKYLRLLARVGRLGGIAMFHCEDGAILDYCRAALFASGKLSPRYYPQSKPVEAEISATAEAINMAAVAEVPSYIVHLSAAAALEEALSARSRGVRVYVETRPLYLYLTADRFEAEDHVAARYIGTPPLRNESDRDRLWQALASQEIDVVASDHVGFTADQKYVSGDTFDTVPKGVANLQSLLPMLYSEAVHRRGVSVERFVQLISTNPARLFGLYPRKGTIAPGADADICILDPSERRILTGSQLQSAADLELFEGTEVMGWPVFTICRGEVVFENDRVVGRPGHGRFVPGLPRFGART